MPEIGRKLESRINRDLAAKARRRIFDGFEGEKVVNEVLDRSTMLTIYSMINSHVISYVNGVVNAGKESLLFWAVDGDGRDVALKIYLVTTSSFKHRQQYILGDPRFGRVKKGTRNMVYLWAKKEFSNLMRCTESRIPVPTPIRLSKNVLAMEFVGIDGVPSRTLLESQVDKSDYRTVVDMLRRLYREANLVHGDLSPYNIFKTDGGLVLFDMGSAVDVRHPNSDALLKRDINNMTTFFVKRGLVAESPSDVLDAVIG